MFVCSFFVRAGRFKRPLGGDQEGSQLLFVFFAYRSFIIFGSARFGLHTTVLVKGLSCFYYDGKLCKFSFSFSFRRYCLIIQICFFDICICFLRPIKMAEEE